MRDRKELKGRRGGRGTKKRVTSGEKKDDTGGVGGVLLTNYRRNPSSAEKNPERGGCRIREIVKKER